MEYNLRSNSACELRTTSSLFLRKAKLNTFLKIENEVCLDVFNSQKSEGGKKKKKKTSENY